MVETHVSKVGILKWPDEHFCPPTVYYIYAQPIRSQQCMGKQGQPSVIPQYDPTAGVLVYPLANQQPGMHGGIFHSMRYHSTEYIQLSTSSLAAQFSLAKPSPSFNPTYSAKPS